VFVPFAWNDPALTSFGEAKLDVSYTGALEAAYNSKKERLKKSVYISGTFNFTESLAAGRIDPEIGGFGFLRKKSVDKKMEPMRFRVFSACHDGGEKTEYWQYKTALDIERKIAPGSRAKGHAKGAFQLGGRMECDQIAVLRCLWGGSKPPATPVATDLADSPCLR
jgi:hypothetical protein